MTLRAERSSFYITILCTAGLLISLWLTYIHVRVHMDPMYESVCAVGDILNCESVAASRFSVIAHIPVSVLASVFYIIFGVFSISTFKQKGLQYTAVAAALGLSAALGSLFFIGISFLFLRAFCPGCAAAHLVNFSLAFLTRHRLCQQKENFIPRLKSELAELIRNRWVTIQIAALLILFIAAGPLGGFPRYWEISSWRSGVPFSHGVEKNHLPWIGADKPSFVIQEYFDYECPACRSSHKKLRRLLSTRSDKVRIVRHDMSRVECIDKKGVPIENRCAAARAAFCAAAQNRFWDFNDAFIADPRPEKLFSRKQHVLKLAAHLGFKMSSFSACLDTPETFSYVQKIYEDGMKRGIESTPTYFVDGKKMKSKELIPLVRSL